MFWLFFCSNWRILNWVGINYCHFCCTQKHKRKSSLVLTGHVCWSKTKLQGAQSTGMLDTQVQLWLQFLLFLKEAKRSSYSPLWHLKNSTAVHISKRLGRTWNWNMSMLSLKASHSEEPFHHMKSVFWWKHEKICPDNLVPCINKKHGLI